MAYFGLGLFFLRVFDEPGSLLNACLLFFLKFFSLWKILNVLVGEVKK